MTSIKGEIEFDAEVLDVTDPCYDKDVWCRATVPITPGRYRYTAIIKDCGVWGNRVKELRIVSAGAGRVRKGEVVRFIGVDAGLAGFFVNKPDYDDEKWDEICDFIYDTEGCTKIHAVDEKTPLGCVGVFSSSGYGDGEYAVRELLDGDGYRCGYAIEF